MDRYQSTIRQKIRMIGTGLHTGRQVSLAILPAVANTGIVFQRTDIAGALPIAASVANITNTALSTTISHAAKPANSVSTIEHLMAALVGVGVDNAIIQVDAPEVPIMDGSAGPFVEQLLAAGIRQVEGFRRLFLVKEAFQVGSGDRFMRVEPADRLSFRCEIDFASSVIGHQDLDFTFNRAAFLEISGARTFCHVKEIDAMRAAGLALGGSLDNAVVVDDNSVINREGLRAHDEFVRHKLLDCIGDMALLGAPLIGRVTLSRAGHALHAQFMRELLARKAELLTVVEIGPFRSKPAIPEGLQAIAAAAAIYG